LATIQAAALEYNWELFVFGHVQLSDTQFHDSGLPLNLATSPAAPAAEINLCDLQRNLPARISRIAAPATVEEQHIVLRLIEIGFLPGEAVRVVAHGHPGREPIAVRLGHTTFALRRHEAGFIHVETGK
jgi:ferrous iron transport protein A